MKSARLLRFFALCGVLSFALTSAHAQDSWQGSYGGFWSNGGNWTTGLPTSADNVVIYTGANDLVYLDVSPTVNSLTLGGAYNGYTSELSDNSIARMLTISQALTINPSGSLVLTGGSNVTIGTDFVNAGFVSTNSFFSIGGNFDNQGTAYLGGGISATGTFTTEAGAYSDFFGGVNHVGALVNNGYLEVDAGSTLIVAGGSSVTDIPSTAGYQIAGTFTIGGGDPFASLTSIEGTLDLSNQSTNISPIGGTLTLAGSAQLLPNNATNLTINGNLDNSGYVLTDGTGNNLTITGSMTNQANGVFDVGGSNASGDTAAISGSLTNYGHIYMSTQNTFMVNGNVTNLGQISTGQCECYGGGNTITFNGLLTNTATGRIYLNGPGDTLQVAGNVNNSGVLATSTSYYGGGNIISVTGLLTNNSTGQIVLYGPGDMLQASGGIANSGSISVNNSSTVDPPFLNNLGTISIDSTSAFIVGTGSPTGFGYIQLANGTLGEMISSNAFGVINVSGPPSLNGTLDILLQGGFIPKVGSSYAIILFSPGGLTGTFANIQNDIFNNGTEFWKITYDDANGFVDLTAAPNGSTTPEPTSFLLLGTGLLGLSYGMRRRLKS